MKRWMGLLVMGLALATSQAYAAKGFGGGKSFGQQSNRVTQRYRSPDAPAKPTQTSADKGSNNPADAPAAGPNRPLGRSMLGTLAAGLGLAWLANALGLGPMMGQFVTFALLALLAVLAFYWLRRLRRPAAAPSPLPFAFQTDSQRAVLAANYRPENVGNDASARPWEQGFEPGKPASRAAGGGSIIGSDLSGSQTWGVPPDFDCEGFLRNAKANFKSLQCAWDKSDMAALRLMMTDAMAAEIQSQLDQREAHTGDCLNMTEVVMIEAHLLGIEDLNDEYMASVEFSGLIREQPSAGATPFREVWNMTRAKNSRDGWLVAGVQALQ